MNSVLTDLADDDLRQYVGQPVISKRKLFTRLTNKFHSVDDICIANDSCSSRFSNNTSSQFIKSTFVQKPFRFHVANHEVFDLN